MSKGYYIWVNAGSIWLEIRYHKDLHETPWKGEFTTPYWMSGVLNETNGKTTRCSVFSTYRKIQHESGDESKKATSISSLMLNSTSMPQVDRSWDRCWT